MMFRGEAGMASFDPHQKREHSPLHYSEATGRPDADLSRTTQGTKPPQGGSDSSAEAQPRMLGRYEIIKELGAGQMGTVYRGRDKVLEREVAIKVPKLDNSEIQALMIRRFYREARAVARLNHPSICPIYDVGEVDGKVFIAMGFITGTTLDRLVGNGKSLRPRVAAKLVHRACLAMQHAHDHHVVHRDLKTSNMMIDASGQPVILDFGLAMLRDDRDASISHDGQILGSPAYMSPEQVNGLGVDHRADIFSMGIVLYEALTGQRPFKGTFTQVLMGIAQGLCEAPHVLNVEVPVELSEICQRMMATSVELRFQTMKEVAEALTKHLSGMASGVGREASNLVSDPQSRLRRTSVIDPESLSPVQDERADRPSRPKSDVEALSAPRKRRKVVSSAGLARDETQSTTDPSVKSLWRQATEAVRPGASQLRETRRSKGPSLLLVHARWWIVSLTLAVASWIGMTLFVGKSSPRAIPSIDTGDNAQAEAEIPADGEAKASFSLDDLDSSP